MFKKAIILLINALIFNFYTAKAQIGGKGVFKFLNLPNSAKVAASGNAPPIGVDTEFNEAFVNPSLINKDHTNTLSLNYSNYISDINYGAIQYGLKLKNSNPLSLGLLYINYGDFEEYNDNGTPTGNNFSAGDYLLNIGYSKYLKSNIYLGANAKFIYGSYDIYSSFALATDVAATYKDTTRQLAFGVIFKNLGYQLTSFNQTKENLPFQIALSLSKKLKFAPIKYHLSYHNLQNFNINYSNPNSDENIDLISGESTQKQSFFDTFSRHLIIGSELLLSPSFNIMAGYNFQQNKELGINGLGGLNGFSFGFSLHLKKLSLSYAHSTFNAAGSNNYLSLTLKPNLLKF